MTELTLRGVHSDGEHLQLSDPAGNDYLLPIDESLYAAVRGHRLTAAQRRQQGDGGSYRPRDIQAMIRSGMSADEVAETTGESLEHIRRYEHPVLAERAHIARQARETLVYPDSSSDGQPTRLIRLCEERLTMRDVDLDTLQWDAWKQSSGTWYVELTFIAADRQRRAGWEYSRGSMNPLDDEARWLADSGPTDSGPIPNFGSGSERAYNAAHHSSEEEQPQAAAAGSGQLRDHQAETGRILESLRRRRGRQSAEPEAPVADAPASAAGRPVGLTPVQGTHSPAAAVGGETARGRLHAVAETPAAPPDGAHTAPSAPEDAADAGRLPLPPESAGSSSAGSSSAGSPSAGTGSAAAPSSGGVQQDTFEIFDDQPSLLDEPGVTDTTAADSPAVQTPPAAGSPSAGSPSAGSGAGSATGSTAANSAAPTTGSEGEDEPKRRNGRSSVPSWDEIMFGTKRD